MKLFDLLKKALPVVGKVLGISVPDLAKMDLPPEKQLEMEQALLAHESEMKALNIEELKVIMSESLAMIGSEDKYVKRARPTMLYVATGITGVLAIVVGVAILRGIQIDLGAIGALTALLTPLWGAGGYYIHKRSEDKKI